MEETIYLISDGREIVAACDLDGIRPVLAKRVQSITRDFEINLRLDGDEPKAIVCLYASEADHWYYSYPIRKMPLVRGLRAR